MAVGDETVEFAADMVEGMKGRGPGCVGNVDVLPRGGVADVGRSIPGDEFIVLCISAVAS
jgi:hypothetical protein